MKLQEAFPRKLTTQVNFQLINDCVVVDYLDHQHALTLDAVQLGAFGCLFRVSEITAGYRIEFAEPSDYLKAQVRRREPDRTVRWNRVKESIKTESKRINEALNQAVNEVWAKCRQEPKSFKINGVDFKSTKKNCFDSFDNWPETLENYEELHENMRSITNEDMLKAVYENL